MTTGICHITLDQGQQGSNVRGVSELYGSPDDNLSNKSASFLLEISKLLASLPSFCS